MSKIFDQPYLQKDVKINKKTNTYNNLHIRKHKNYSVTSFHIQEWL